MWDQLSRSPELKFKCALLSSFHLNLGMTLVAGKPERSWDVSESSEKVKGCHSIREGHRCQTEVDKLQLGVSNVCVRICACICCMGECVCVCLCILVCTGWKDCNSNGVAELAGHGSLAHWPSASLLGSLPLLSSLLGGPGFLYLSSPDFLPYGGLRNLRALCHPASLSLAHGSLVTQIYHILPVNGPKEGLKSPQDQPLIQSVHLTLNLTECPSGVAGWQIAVASLLLSPRTPRGRHRLQCAGVWPGARWICWGSALCLQGEKKILGCLATSGQARKGREAVSHFWAGFLAVLTHCDLKQFLSLLSPPLYPPIQGCCDSVTCHLVKLCCGGIKPQLVFVSLGGKTGT